MTFDALRRSALVALALADAACAAQSEPLVWPSAPDKPRIEYVQSFSRAADLGIAKSFLARLKDFFLGEEERRIVRPMAVVAVGGVIYVADPGAQGVHRFDTANGGYDLIAGPDDKPLPSPVGLARGANGEVYVADSMLARIFVIRSGAMRAERLPLDVELAQPTGVAYDAEHRRLFVADTKAHRIDVFDSTGALVNRIGSRGANDGEFNFPTYLWLARQQLYVTDSLNFRVQAFDAQGRFLRRFGRQGGGTGESARPKGVAADRHGHLYLVDALFNAFQVFDGSGQFLLPVGRMGNGRGEFWLPAGIFVDPDDDRIYIADTWNARVQVFRYVGGVD